MIPAETGIRRSDVVNWYLKEREAEIESEAELEEHTFLIGKVIDRLVKNVRNEICKLTIFIIVSEIKLLNQLFYEQMEALAILFN